MRSLLFVFAAATTIAVPSSTTPVFAQSYCQCVCRYMPHGRECRRVCYAPPATYVPAQSYRYTPPVYGSAPFEFPPELIGMAFIAAAVLGTLALIGAISNSGTTALITETERLRSGTAAMDAEASHTRRQTAELEAEMERRAAESFQRGQRQAEAEWYGRG